ncbi:MAG: DNA-binding response regulator [Clostridium sp.]|nr:DNA-binding response regulator [Clostridium sp.]MBQ9072690.1 DNA-binding response regulator [Bacilli bacterium]
MLGNKDKYFKKLHKSSKGYITIASKSNGWFQKSLKLDKIDYENMAVGQDMYISQNTFSFPNRRLINLQEINALYIDIDCYKANLTKEGALFFLQDLYGEIPRPNYIIDSGRGLYYVILLENTTNKDLALWKTVEVYLFEKMKHLGADPQCLEATRVLRTVGSYNSKSKSEVKILEEYDYRYTLEEIQEHYIPELTEVIKKPKKPKTKKRGRPKKIISIFNLYNLYAKRIEDIETLCELRSYDLKGHRELILFLYRYFSNVFYADSEEGFLNTLELNSRFLEPLDEYELTVDTQSAERYWSENRYKYSNAKLIRLLDITEEEQKYLVTIIGTREKYNRNNDRRRKAIRNEQGFTEAQLKRLQKVSKAKILKEQGMKYEDIAKELKVSLRTVKNYIKE